MTAAIMACGRCRQPRCRLCYLFEHDPRYRALWLPFYPEPDPPASARPNRDLTKPKLSIDELAAKRRRCGEAKRQGKPCTEFSRSADSPSGQSATENQVSTEPGGEMARPFSWAYGVTTVPQRRAVLLPQTLASLALAGFDRPVLFVDGCSHQEAAGYEAEFGLPTVSRYPNIRTFGNWALALAELYIRNPMATRYAVFQDDFVCSLGLRSYLEATTTQQRAYWNCYTFDYNYARTPRDQTTRRERLVGWHPTNGRGLGAVALIFSREGVQSLLSQRDNIVDRPTQAGKRAWSAIDGGIVEAMRKQGYFEHVHHPSLVQHRGHVSVMKNPRHRDAVNFWGEQFDLTSLLRPGKPPSGG